VSVERIETLDGEAPPELERRVRDEVAHRIRARIRATDRLLRESERDACVLLPAGGDGAAQRVVERFVRALNGPYSIGSQLVRVRVRVGSAVHPAHGGDAAELLRKAAEPLCG
jgi:GGDEF domain-containing protein